MFIKSILGYLDNGRGIIPADKKTSALQVTQTSALQVSQTSVLQVTQAEKTERKWEGMNLTLHTGFRGNQTHCFPRGRNFRHSNPFLNEEGTLYKLLYVIEEVMSPSPSFRYGDFTLGSVHRQRLRCSFTRILWQILLSDGEMMSIVTNGKPLEQICSGACCNERLQFLVASTI